MLRKNCLLDMSQNEDELLVCISGEIDHHSAVWVRTQIDAEINERRPKRTVLVLSGIDFMDSSGLGLIMGRYSRMQAIGGDLLVREPNERIVKILKLAGLDKIVKIENAKEAKESKNEG